MNPPYSLVCAGRHVLGDEIAHQPAVNENGTKLCSTPGCFERVYSHCVHCAKPIPGYIDGVRYEVHGNIAAPAGRMGTARGLLPGREWREDCPYCKVPYPWASSTVLADYHAKYLEDRRHASPVGLSYVAAAEHAFEEREKARKRHRRSSKRADRRERHDHWWTSRAALITAVGVVLAAVVAGVFTYLSRDGSESPVPTSTSTTSTTSAP